MQQLCCALRLETEEGRPGGEVRSREERGGEERGYEERSREERGGEEMKGVERIEERGEGE